MIYVKLLMALGIALCVASCNFAGKSDFENASKDLCECTGKHFEQFSSEFKKDFIEASKENLSLDKTLDVIYNKRKDDANDSKNLKDALMLLQLPDKVDKCLKELEPKYKDLKTLDSQSETLDKFMQSIENQSDCDFLHALLKSIKASTTN